MRLELGRLTAVYRYPVKSMAGERADAADLGWHGVAGDRRLAFRRLADRGSFPWLTASRLPDLIRYQPVGRRDAAGDPLPTHVRTPDGRELALDDDALRAEIAGRHGAEVVLMHLRPGVFDEAAVSAITWATIRGIAGAAGVAPDARRFRPNLVINTATAVPFEEDAWVGKVLEFGPDGTGPAVAVTQRDPRCVMVNLDPDTADSCPAVMRASVRLNDNFAGVYGSVIRTGELRAGQVVVLSG